VSCSFQDVESLHYDLLLFLRCSLCDDSLFTSRLVGALDRLYLLVYRPRSLRSSQRATCIWGFDALRWDILSNESCHAVIVIVRITVLYLRWSLSFEL
jgi:hypothetical protein